MEKLLLTVLTFFSFSLTAQENWEMSAGHLGSGANSNQQLSDRTPKAVRNHHQRPAEMAAILGTQNSFAQSRATKKRITELSEQKAFFFETIKLLTVEGTGGRITNCGICFGIGKLDCNRCAGNGSTECITCSSLGTRTCVACDGVGAISGLSCNVCSGKGYSSCRTCEGKGKRECNYCIGVGYDNCGHCFGSGKQFVGNDSAKVNLKLDSLLNRVSRKGK
jgi:hypothetical protein